MNLLRLRDLLPVRPRRRTIRRSPAVLGLLLPLLWASPASADVRERFLFEGLVSGEAWETDADSTLLSRNEGDLDGEAAMWLWQALRLSPNLHLFAMEELESDGSRDESVHGETELLLVRYSRRSRAPVSVEAGKILTPVGSFPRRRLPDTNPLVGDPLTYETEYPFGIAVTGAVARFDYRASVTSLPLEYSRAMPEPDHAPRPALGAGWTPFAGFRVGAFFTRGPYLNREISDLLPAGSRWREFDQQVLGLELRFARGYFVTEGEWTFSSYEIPAQAPRTRGNAWYLETRYTWTPRLFTALRVERNEYPFVRPVSPSFWLAVPVAFYDAEAGIGYRFTPSTLMKVSYRKDLWRVDDAFKSFYPEGYALSIQLSHRFDLISWFDRKR